jgi:hypothetical protein
VSELGPRTFPAYASATAGLRTAAITDELLFATLSDTERLDELEAWNRAILRPSETLRGRRCPSRCGTWRTAQTRCLIGFSTDRHSYAITQG